MPIGPFFTVFITIFIAEIGDKTQLATLLFSTDENVGRMTVFIAASLALVATSAIGVLAGGWLSGHVDGELLEKIAGVGFIAIGVWTLFS